MSAYKAFRPQDRASTSLVASPLLEFVTGSNGWRSAIGASGSLSVYPGVRSRQWGEPTSLRRYQPIRSYTIDGNYDVTGSYPVTASILMKRLDPTGSAQGDDWGREHWAPIELLYAYYSRVMPQYTTASADVPASDAMSTSYNLTFTSGLRNIAAGYDIWGKFGRVTSSFTLEAQVKADTLAAGPMTIVSKTDFLLFAITNSGRLHFSATNVSPVVSNTTVTPGVWTHVAVCASGTTGQFMINGQSAGTFAFDSFSVNTFRKAYCIGNVFEAPVDLYEEDLDEFPGLTCSGTTQYGFDGQIREVRLWSELRSPAQIQSAMSASIDPTGLTTLVAYHRLDEGPTYTLVPGSEYEDALGLYLLSKPFARGSGALDRSVLTNEDFDLLTPLYLAGFTGSYWHASSSDVSSHGRYLKLFSIPRAMYGRQVKPGSVTILDNTHTLTTGSRTLLDDGRGSLYPSGSIETKVGNVFYNEGIIVITDQNYVAMGDSAVSSSTPTDVVGLSFRSTQLTPTQVLMCRAGGVDANCSNNPTFSTTDEHGRRVSRLSDRTTYITRVALYDRRRRLVGVAKVAQPIRKQEGRRVNVRIRLDY